VPYGIDECAQYPVFPPDLIALMRRLIPPARHATVARSLIFTARKRRGDAPREG
jgi:arsenite methyltransferase